MTVVPGFCGQDLRGRKRVGGFIPTPLPPALSLRLIPHRKTQAHSESIAAVGVIAVDHLGRLPAAVGRLFTFVTEVLRAKPGLGWF